MKPSKRLAMWLVLAADAMFLLALFAAQQFDPPRTGGMDRFTVCIVGALTAGRVFAQFKPGARGSLTLIAIGCFGICALQLLQLHPPFAINFVLRWVFAAHLLALAGCAVASRAALAREGELLLLWNFVLGLGIVLLLAVG